MSFIQHAQAVNRKYGAILLPSDSPKRIATKLFAPKENRPPLPPHVSWLAYLGIVKDQGSLGSCTANAGAGFMEFIDRRFLNRYNTYSPLDLYYEERAHDGTVNEDDGSTGETLFWVLTHEGVCLESQDPYNVRDFRKAPTPEQIAEAAKYKLGAYHRLPDFDAVKYCLASGYCVAIGFPVYSSFESNACGDSGIMPIPQRGEALEGGHEVLVYGYHDTIIPGGALLVRNSWSASWGLNGNFLMPYRFYKEYESQIDAMMGHLGKPW